MFLVFKPPPCYISHIPCLWRWSRMLLWRGSEFVFFLSTLCESVKLSWASCSWAERWAVFSLLQDFPSNLRRCTHLLTSLPATRLLIARRGLRGRGLAADGVIGRSETFTRLVKVTSLRRIQTGVTGFPCLGAGAHLGQRWICRERRDKR